MEKRGQFYLLAAVVIITIISGFAAISNYAQKQGVSKIYDVREELGIEGGKVLEYGVFSGDKQVNVGDKQVNVIEHFVEQYKQYAGENKEIYFIFGNRDEVTLITYDEIISGSLKIVGESGDFQELNIIENEPIVQKITPKGQKVTINIGGIDYDFDIKPGENFFFIISQEIEGEQHVAIS